jgi:hypothetical protein
MISTPTRTGSGLRGRLLRPRKISGSGTCLAGEIGTNRRVTPFFHGLFCFPSLLVRNVDFKFAARRNHRPTLLSRQAHVAIVAV